MKKPAQQVCDRKLVRPLLLHFWDIAQTYTVDKVNKLSEKENAQPIISNLLRHPNIRQLVVYSGSGHCEGNFDRQYPDAFIMEAALEMASASL